MENKQGIQSHSRPTQFLPRGYKHANSWTHRKLIRNYEKKKKIKQESVFTGRDHNKLNMRAKTCREVLFMSTRPKKDLGRTEALLQTQTVFFLEH